MACTSLGLPIFVIHCCGIAHTHMLSRAVIHTHELLMYHAHVPNTLLNTTSRSQVYFNDSVAEAKACVDKAMDK